LSKQPQSASEDDAEFEMVPMSANRKNVCEPLSWLVAEEAKRKQWKPLCTEDDLSTYQETD
jgi:hypothetical protein